jgi:hypothetical protein
MTHIGESTCAMVGPLVAGLTEAKSALQFIFFSLPRQNFNNTKRLFRSLAEMSRNTVQPNGWVAIRLPSEVTRVLQIVPHT